MENFEAIYHENYPKMYRLAYKMTNDRDIVHDILQDIFIGFYEKFEQGHKILQPTSWLLRATVNKSIDVLNRRKKFTDLESLNQDFEEKEDSESEHKKVLLQQALSKLKPQEKTLAILYSEGFSYKEIATITNINFSSVGKLLSRTLQKLKELLKQSDYEMYE